MQRKIENRADVEELVHSFYAKIREHTVLGPIFNRAIPEDKWDSHLDKLSDFWESNLFFVAKFKGDPVLAHKEVDAREKHSIEVEHFGMWLQLWHQTIDERFIGLKAQLAKDRARNMSSMMFRKIWMARPGNQSRQ